MKELNQEQRKKDKVTKEDSIEEKRVYDLHLHGDLGQ